MDFLKSMADRGPSGLRAQSGRMRVDLGEHRERGLHRRSVPAPIPTGGRFRRSAPRSTAPLQANTIAMGKVRQDPSDFPHQVRGPGIRPPTRTATSNTRT